MLTKKSIPHIFIASLFLLEACAPTLPLTKKTSLSYPESYPQQDLKLSDQSSADFSWQKFFHDQNLTQLIETALKNNQELAMLEQEINIANNEIMARKGEYLPKFMAGANGGVEKTERFSSEDANQSTKFQRLGMATTWEVDIWKKLRNAAKSAYFNYLASIEGRKYLVTNLVAEVSNTYFELMALDTQLKIVDNYIDILSRIKEMVTLQQSAARVTSLAVKRFEAEVFRNKSRKYEIQQKIFITQNKLNLLLGRFPQPIRRDSDSFSSYHLDQLTLSVPTKLLDNRPDVKKAKLGLEASQLDVEVAKARFYPSLTIDGSYGWEKFNSKHFEGNSPTSIFYGLAAGITAPLLNRKAIKADYFSANNKQIQAVYNFEMTMIKAYTEVANQINSLKNLETIYDLKEKQVSAMNQSVDISNILFQAARVDYIESLFTQRDALESQIELVEIKKQLLSASVDLYKAIGGGWQGTESTRESY